MASFKFLQQEDNNNEDSFGSFKFLNKKTEKPQAIQGEQTLYTPSIEVEKKANSIFEKFKDIIKTPAGQAIKSGISSVIAPKINAVKQVGDVVLKTSQFATTPRNINQDKVESYRKASELGIVPPTQQNVDQNFEYRKSLEEGAGKIASTNVGAGISQGTRGTRLVAPYAAAYNYIAGKESGDYLDVYNKTIQNIDRKMQDPTNSFGENFLYSFSDSVPQTLVGSALSLVPVVGKPLSTLFFGIVSAESQMREKGKVSAPNVVIDTLGDRLLGANIEKLLATPAKELIKSGMWGYVKRQGKQGLVEGITEPSQTILKYVSDYKDAKTPEQKQAILTEAKDYVLKGGLLMESLVGFSAGFLISGGIESLDTQQKKKVEETIKNITPEKDSEFTDPQIKVRKAFRQQVLQSLSQNNWDVEKAAQQISDNTGISLPIASQMVSELQNNEAFISETISTIREQVTKKQEIAPEVKQQVQEVAAQFNRKPEETSTPDSLMEEAKKYKSADEFVNSQRKMYRGTALPQKGELDVADTYGLAYGKGAYLASDESFAKQYGENISELYPVLKKPFSMDKEVSPEFLKQFKKDFPAYSEKYGTTGEDIHSFLSQDEANEYLQKLGYDGLIDAASEGSKQTIVFDPKNIKTKEQLTEIYNKATGKESSKTQEKSLIVQHNLSEKNLLYSSQKGGIPVPSLAISNKNMPLSNFGEITLIGDKSLADPADKNNKVYNADVYSKRYPRLQTTVKNMQPVQDVIDETKDYFTNLDLPEWRNYDRAESMRSSIEDEGLRGMIYDFSMRRAFAAKKGIAKTSTRQEIEDFTNQKDINNEYEEFVENLYNKMQPQERIFKGFTYSGTRRYSPATIENIVKEMKGAVKDTEGFNYGVPSLRASQAKQFKSLDSILKNKDKIVSEQDMEMVKDAFDREFNDLLDAHDISDINTFTVNLKDWLNKKISFSEFQKYTGISVDGASEFATFAKQLKDAPTEYFEVKPQRLVGINEFKIAVVPNTISKRTRTVLEDKGIDIVEYDPEVKGDREIKIKNAADTSDISFNKKGSRITLPEMEANPENAKKLMKQNGVIGVDPKLVEIILTPEGKRAYGVYVRGTLSLERFVQAFTEEHEVFHLLFQNMEKFGQFKNFDKKALFEEARALYGEDLTDAQLEEEMAVDFQQYLYERQNNQPSSFFGLIKETFERWFAILKRAFTQQNNINELYRTITEGKANAQTFIPNVMPASFNRKVREGIVDFRTQKATGDFLKGKLVSDVFTDSGDLTLKTITKLEGRKTVSKQYVIDISKQQGISKPETELINAMLATEGDTINVADFVARVKDELLPLTRNSTDIEFNGEFDDNPFAQSSQPAYENIVLPEEIRGNVKNYIENVYESPIQTSAGDTHFRNSKLNTGNYFGHTRIEDMQDEELRRVIEVQSDLYQKGNLEKELDTPERVLNSKEFAELKNLYKERTAIENQTDIKDIKSYTKKVKEIATQERALQDKIKYAPTDRELSNAKLQQYNDPTAHFRMIREEIKRAAQDGKTRLQFPMGETAMKIEGLGENTQWRHADIKTSDFGKKLNTSDLKIGYEIEQGTNGGATNNRWIITDVLGDGKFKAVPKDRLDDLMENAGIASDTIEPTDAISYAERHITDFDRNMESFDISGKVDTNNPIYKFYEKDVQKYLKNNYDAVPVTDDQGVSWMEVPINSYMAYQPVPAFNLKPEYDEFGEPVLRYDQEEEIPIQKNPPVATAKEALDLAEKRVGVKPVELTPKQRNQAENQLRRTELSLQNAQANPEAHEKAYGKDKIPEYIEKITELEQKLAPVEKKVRSISPKKITLSPELQEQENKIQQLSMQIEFMDDLVNEHPGKKLTPLLFNKEGTFEDLKNPYENALGQKRTPEETEKIQKVNARVVKMVEKAFEGSSDPTLYEKFDDPDVIREQIDEYKARKQEVKDLRDERIALKKKFYAERNLFYLEERDRFVINKMVSDQERLRVIDEVQKILRKEGRDRMQQVRAIQEHFMLEDSAMKRILYGKPDLRLLSDAEYKKVLDSIEEEVNFEMQKREAIMALQNTIHEMDLKKVDNLREAMKLGDIQNMTTEQINKFNDLLQTFQPGDMFLGMREIQTAPLTNLGEIKTYREARELLAKEAGLPVETIGSEIQIEFVDRFLYDTALGRRNALFKVLVDNYQRTQVQAAVRFAEIKSKTEKLFTLARNSRNRSLTERLVPTDELIFQYLESNETEKKFLAKKMTPAELRAAVYVQEQYQIIRDYLINQGTLEKYRENYVTHIRRSFLESLKENGKNIFSGGLKQMFNELKDSYVQERANFNILNDKTGEVLALEKFFKYSMQREGNLVPTKNVARAFLGYLRTFEKKRALDAFVPKIDIFVHVLTPQETTSKGLIKNDTLEVFIKKWLNTKKGRYVDAVFSPGDRGDTALRAGIAMFRILKLGLNIPGGIASRIGATFSTYSGLGEKDFAIGTARSYTAKGKEIGKKYEDIVGESIWTKLQDASKDVGEKAYDFAYSLYSEADRNAKTIYILGKMTKEEFESGTLSDERLTEIVRDMSRFHKMDGMESLMGKTAFGKMFTQFKGWAVPLLHTNIDNISKVSSMIKKGDNPLKTKEGVELLRMIILQALVILLSYNKYQELKDKKDKTFMENLAYKSMNDAFSLIGALDPKMWVTGGALPAFLSDLTVSMSMILKSLATNERTAEGKIEGMTQFKGLATPQAIKQFLPPESPSETIKSSMYKSISAAKKELEGMNDVTAQAGIDAREKIMSIPEGPDRAKAVKKILDGLTDPEYEAYKLAKKSDVDYWKKVYKKITPIVEEVNTLKTELPDDPESKKKRKELMDSMTDEEYEVYKKIKKAKYGIDIDANIAKEEAKKEFEGFGVKKYDEQNFIEKVFNIAKAVTMDPVDTFNAIFSGDYQIRGVSGGQVIVNRAPEEKTQKIREERGVTKANTSEWRLDHVVPLIGGGLNKESNLQLITTQQHASNTAAEIMIGKALRDKKITGNEAAEYIIRYKAGKGQPLSPKLQRKYKNKYKSTPLSFEEIKTLVQ